MELEMDLYFVDGIMLIALMAFAASVGHALAGLFRAQFPSLFRMAARFEDRHPGLFDGGDTFYCFFRKGALYGK